MYSSSSSSGCLANILAKPPPSPRAMAPLPIEPFPNILLNPLNKPFDLNPIEGGNALPPNKEPNPGRFPNLNPPAPNPPPNP